MIRRASFELLVGIFLISAAASAQNRFSHVRLYSPPARMAGTRPVLRTPAAQAPMPAPVARPVIVRLPGTPAVQRIAITTNSQQASLRGEVFSSGSTFAPDFSLAGGASSDLGQLLNNVPGLGFDFSHLAALNHDLGVRAIIDPVTQHELAIAEQLLRDERSVGTSAFVPFYGEGYSEPAVYQQQPPVIVLQQPAPQAQPTPEETAAPPAAAEQPPLPPVGEFVLVLRSGKQIKAVAFTRQSDSIVYITGDGIRGSFPVTDLDTAATEQLNQHHGTPLKISL
ncbi:MAG TPA: hypothetical protein VKS20_02010 [Candidatus Acidoferrales bacterium]|nr:hypothetical protein [Candidatus Acidoferrales bacterium]